MAEPTDDLGRKCAAIDSLEKAVEDARYEISLLKVGEQEKVRKIAALEEKIQELEELQSAGNREIDELYTIVDDERAKVETVEELVKDLSRKCAAVDTLEKDVEDAEYEIDLLKDSEQEANRQVAEMSKKIQELEKLHAAVNRDRDREIDELVTIVEDERAKVEALKELVKAKDQQLEALAQKVQQLITIQEKNAREKDRCRAGDAPAPIVAEGKYETKNTKKSKKQAETEHSKEIAPTVCGRTVSLLTYDWHYLCGNYGDAPVTITGRGAKKDSVRFTVENAGNGEVALKSCGKYLSILKDGSVTCVSRTRDKLSHFDWIEHATGEVSLRGANGKYVSSAYEGTSMTCTRAEAGPEERFIVM
ncbi:hypothetical protein AAVH_24482 [Aphelenchoides avenae]|nr:hypothetical protein AAVH_24482 [Aphelenchus avenae]